jgi:hypothetical protein
VYLENIQYRLPNVVLRTFRAITEKSGKGKIVPIIHSALSHEDVRGVEVYLHAFFTSAFDGSACHHLTLLHRFSFFHIIVIIIII